MSSRPYAFLLGAGSSLGVDIPTMESLLSRLLQVARERFPDWHESLWGEQGVVQRLQAHLDADNKENLEVLLELLDGLCDGEAGIAVAKILRAKVKVSGREASLAAAALRTLMREVCLEVDPRKTTLLQPIANLARRQITQGPLDIYTTNYDTVIEALCIKNRLTYTDGMVPTWDPAALGREGVALRILRLHGACHWYETTEGAVLSSPILVDATSSSAIRTAGGLEATPFIMYPGQKMSFNAPSTWNLLGLSERLAKPSFRLLVVCGSRLEDRHIIEALHEGARRNPGWILANVSPKAGLCRARLEGEGAGRTPLANRVVYVHEGRPHHAGWAQISELVQRQPLLEIANLREEHALVGFKLGRTTDWGHFQQYLNLTCDVWPQETALRIGEFVEFEPGYWTNKEAHSWFALGSLLTASLLVVHDQDTNARLRNLEIVLAKRIQDLAPKVIMEGSEVRVEVTTSLSYLNGAFTPKLMDMLANSGGHFSAWERIGRFLDALTQTQAHPTISKFVEWAEEDVPQMTSRHWPDGKYVYSARDQGEALLTAWQEILTACWDRELSDIRERLSRFE